MKAPNTTRRPSRLRHHWSPLRLAFLVLGVGLLLLLLYQVGLTTLLAHARRLGWTFLAVVGLFGGVHFLRAVSWRICLQQEGERLPLRAALSLWLAGEGVAYLSFGWSGEAFRAAAIRETIPVERGLSALLVSRMVYIYASLMLIAVSFLLGLFFLPLAGLSRAVLAALTGILVGVSLLPLAGGGGVSRVLQPLSALLARHSRSSILGSLHRFLQALENDLAAVFSRKKGTFAPLVGLNLLATLAGVLEVYLILRALDVAVSLPTALLIEGINKGLALFAFFVPGNVGVREGGNVLAFQLLEMSAALAVTLVLVRRARALVWVGIGSLLVLRHGLSPLLPAGSTIEANPNDEMA
ncbi:MAG: lysylphosphatidylglycerol synthase domain-containing protein [Terriglobia bacterium]